MTSGHMTMTALVVASGLGLYACSKDRGTPESKKDPTPESKKDPTPEPVGADAAAAPTGLDTSGWEVRELASLGEEPFSFAATIRVPPGSKSKSFATTAGGEEAGVMAYLDLEDGTRVIVSERSPNAPDDPEMLKGILGSTGKVVVDRRGPTWYLVGVDQGAGGIAVQGDSWAVRPGISCATEKPLDGSKGIERVLSICTSLAAK
jgi:hypothetical protein